MTTDQTPTTNQPQPLMNDWVVPYDATRDDYCEDIAEAAEIAEKYGQPFATNVADMLVTIAALTCLDNATGPAADETARGLHTLLRSAALEVALTLIEEGDYRAATTR